MRRLTRPCEWLLLGAQSVASVTATFADLCYTFSPATPLHFHCNSRSLHDHNQNVKVSDDCYVLNNFLDTWHASMVQALESLPKLDCRPEFLGSHRLQLPVRYGLSFSC